MNDLVERIQVVMNTIQDLDIKSTFDNMNHLMGVLQELARIRDEVQKIKVAEASEAKDQKTAEVSEDGNADAE